MLFFQCIPGIARVKLSVPQSSTHYMYSPLLVLLQVCSCSADGTVRLWDFTDGILIKVCYYIILY